MILGRVGIESYEDFSVTDSNDTLVPSIDSTAFTMHLFDNNGSEVSSSTLVNIIELGFGHYRASFTPNNIGMWMLSIYHNTHFPAGKTGSIQVFNNDFDTMTTLITRILGLTQENFYIDNTAYDSFSNMTDSRIRIYNSASNVGTSSGVIATYVMIAIYDSEGNMTSYNVQKS
jgi:hypothetical protein